MGLVGVIYTASTDADVTEILVLAEQMINCIASYNKWNRRRKKPFIVWDMFPIWQKRNKDFNLTTI